VAESYATSQVHANPKALQRLIDLVQPKAGRVIDIAAGAGNTALSFSPHVERVVATDFTPEMAGVCRNRAIEAGLRNFSVAVCRAEALPFLSHAFEGASCRIAPHHFDSPPHFIGEVKRVVKPGGWFLLIDNVGPEDSDAARKLDDIERERDPSHRSYLAAELWRGLLTDYGFKIRHEEGASKEIEVQDWLDRMRVAAETQAEVRRRMSAATGALRDYLRYDGSTFNLREHLFLADNPS
jgi:ubiquinone/menaquinone biosynthesis C-methylase UbiE